MRATNHSKRALKIMFHRIGIYMLRKNIEYILALAIDEYILALAIDEYTRTTRAQLSIQ